MAITEEGRRRISESRSGTTLSEETRKKISIAMKARRLSEGHRRRIGEANRGNKRPDLAARNVERTGSKLSLSTRKKMSRSHLARIESHLENATDCRCPLHGFMHGPSGIENILRNVILVDFPEVVCEKRFGRFRVDAYLPPPYHLAFEADGEHWHNKKYDKKRDAELMKRFGLPVVRMSEQELNGVAR